MQHKIAMKKNRNNNRNKHDSSKSSLSAIKFPVFNFNYKRSVLAVGKTLFGLFIILHIVLPIVVIAWPNSMSHILFQTFVNLPFKNLSNPESFGLKKTYHCKMEHDNVSLGLWHTLPNDEELVASGGFEEHFRLNIGRKENEILVLYLHGNTFDRAVGHRIELYKLLQSLGYHVVSFDYRGYGDSTGIPTEEDVVKDAMFMFEYFHSLAPKTSIYVYGHSLGTGVSTKLNRLLNEKNKFAAGVILEAPFYNVLEEVELHPLAKIWIHNPLMLAALKNALHSIPLHFRSDIHITKIKSKLLILHAEDDGIIPIQQGINLYNIAKEKGISSSVEFIKFDYNLDCGHRNIYLAPNFVEIIRKFII